MIFTVSSDINLEEENEDWQGFVEAIKRFISKKDEDSKERMKLQSEKIEQVQKDVNSIKVMI